MKSHSFSTRRVVAAIHPFLFTLTLCLMIGGCGGSSTRSRPESSLAEKDRTMLQQYETIRAALAQDDFRTVKRTATKFQQALEAINPPDPKAPGLEFLTRIANAPSLEPQREAFRSWSQIAIEATKDVQGFYVVHCPLPNCGDWLQRDTKVDNPYMGKSMRDCGEVEK